MVQSRIRLLFDLALAVDTEQRSAWLDKACGGDRELREAVAALLEAARDGDQVVGRVVGDATERLLREVPKVSYQTARLRALQHLISRLKARQ